MSNPLSAITESPFSRKSNSPLFLVSSLSEIDPGYQGRSKRYDKYDMSLTTFLLSRINVVHLVTWLQTNCITFFLGISAIYTKVFTKLKQRIIMSHDFWRLYKVHTK